MNTNGHVSVWGRIVSFLAGHDSAGTDDRRASREFDRATLPRDRMRAIDIKPVSIWVVEDWRRLLR